MAAPRLHPEAIALADRVLVIDAGRWTAVVDVRLPRPRDRTAPAFAALRRDLLDAVCRDCGRLIGAAAG